MRISDSMISSSLIAQLGRASTRLFQLQEQVASGLAFRTLSQNPAGSVRAASLRSSIAELSRYRTNTDDARERLSLTEIPLASIIESLREARLAALSLSHTGGGNDALADTVHQISDQIVRGINFASQGRYLFGGYKSLAPPIVENVAGVPPYLYQGDRGDVSFQLSRGVSIIGNLDAAEVLNLDGAADPALDDTLETLRKLEIAIRAGDGDAVEAELVVLEKHFDHVVSLRGAIGARVQHVELAATRLDSVVLTLQGLLSETQDVDITQAVTELRGQEITYQAAAAAAAALHRASLLDYFI